MKEIVGRFAPTPSGALHPGNLFCSLLAWLSVRKQGGRMLLRIEDLDAPRCRPEYTAQAEADLLALGLDWDEGGSAGGPSYFQSRRSAYYAELTARLEERGLVYPCFCTRAELHAASAPHLSDGEPIYDGKCRALTPAAVEELRKTKRPSLRLKAPQETLSFRDLHYGEQRYDLSRDCGDFILRRSDGVYAYQLAVAADDAAMGVTEVVRGRDLLGSTPKQIFLNQTLGLSVPVYGHVPLLLAHDGRRLSKRERDQSLSGLLARGFRPEEIVGKLAFLAGLLERPEPTAPRELIPLFSWEKVPREDVRLPEDFF